MRSSLSNLAKAAKRNKSNATVSSNESASSSGLLGSQAKRRSPRFSKNLTKSRKTNNATTSSSYEWRKWISTGLGEARKGMGVKKTCQNRPRETPITVMSYNVLADYLMKWHRELYSSQPEDALDWTIRWTRIKEEIYHYNPDVLCLQEVQDDHFYTYFVPDLKVGGYEGLFKRRTGDKHDGCAIFFRQDKFQLVDFACVEYFQPGIPVLDRDNVGLLVRLNPLNTDRYIVVATTHLLYNPKRLDIKLAQLALLFAELDRFTASARSGQARDPCILAGDFNFNPDSPLYQNFIQRGNISYGHLLRNQTMALLPPEIGITDDCRHIHLNSKLNNNRKPLKFSYEGFHKTPNSLVHQDPPEAGGTSNTGMLWHNLNLRSAYRYNSDEATSNQHNGFVVVDYMLYSTRYNSQLKRLIEGNLKLLSRLKLPSVHQCREHGGLPSRDFPSDHVSLVAKFLLTS